MSQLFASAQEVIDILRPRDPVHCVRPAVLAETAKRLVDAFPGDVLYAVKCNETEAVVDGLHDGGIRHFDTASIAEVRQISARYPDAVCHFMHPVKSREAIAEAYFKFGVTSYVVDHVDELQKILDVTRGARDLTLVVRLEMPRGQAMMCLSGKFGCSVAEGARLLRLIEASGNRSGLTFHVGSQCIDPRAFAQAIALCGQAIEASGVEIDVLDVGGGFPGRYTGEEPEFEEFVDVIVDACAAIDLPEHCRLQCEPGRLLVADGVSVLARVELRRDDALYLNDGTYGALPELKYLGNCFPMRLRRPGEAVAVDGPATGFDLYGPTCDSIDSMPGPHWICGDVREGDWIEIGRMGAYSSALRTRFNGFGTVSTVTVTDDEVLRPSVVVSLEELRSAA